MKLSSKIRLRKTEFVPGERNLIASAAALGARASCPLLVSSKLRRLIAFTFVAALLSLNCAAPAYAEETRAAYSESSTKSSDINDDAHDDDDDDDDEEREKSGKPDTPPDDAPAATAVTEAAKPVSAEKTVDSGSTAGKPEVNEKSSAAKSNTSERHTNPGKFPEGFSPSFYIDSKYSKKILEKTDAVVCKRLFSKRLADTVWKDALKRQYETIVDSKNLRDLGLAMSVPFAALKSSHCNFVTINDEMYHFLHSLFSDFNKKLNKGKIDYVGFVTGSAGFDDNQVRYVLTDSPAAKAGIEIGDRILKVNGIDYVGYANIIGTFGKTLSVQINRQDDSKTVSIKPDKVDLYSAYVEATRKSARVEHVNGKNIGYVHVWCGGRKNSEALNEILEDKLVNTDGLIFDLRDGYGGNSLSDLDRFYRDPKAYPDFDTVNRNGKRRISRYYYDKPVVAIINGGSRSGKELLSFSLKRTGRAKLIGTKTAGAVLAGSLSPIDEKTTAYIAVLDGTIGGVRLEGIGVAPDIEIDNPSRTQAGYDKQVTLARDTLLELIKSN